MKQALILAGAALALAAAPAAAKPGKGHGKHEKHGGYSQSYYGSQYGYAQRGCPPGQAKKLARGQRYSESYGYDRYAYNRIPYDVRQQYDLDPNNRYYYDQGNLYGVDPQTQIIEQIIGAILR
jgi:hypothetical protein